MSTVLVTGATTPIGQAVCESLLREDPNARVMGLGRERVMNRPLAQELRERFSYHSVDLTRSRHVRSLLFGEARERGVETVIHTAHHRRAHDGGRRVHRLNVDATRELVRLCERHPTISRFVYRSYAEVYRIDASLPDVLREDSPIEMSRAAPQWIRDRVEADVTVSTYLGSPDLRVCILRFTECLAAHVGSQLYDYLDDRLCLRPLGFDPMLNLISIADLVAALVLAARSDAQGIFNAPGADTLPLSALVEKHRRRGLAIPGPLLSPLYALRTLAKNRDFHYQLNRWRFHFSGVMDGTRAKEVLGYVPQYPLEALISPRTHD